MGRVLTAPRPVRAGNVKRVEKPALFPDLIDMIEICSRLRQTFVAAMLPPSTVLLDNFFDLAQERSVLLPLKYFPNYFFNDFSQLTLRGSKEKVGLARAITGAEARSCRQKPFR